MIQDSGTRKQFESGAVRDVQVGKGRCDLLPLEAVHKFIEVEPIDDELRMLACFVETGNRKYFLYAAKKFALSHFGDVYTAIIEYSKHLEEGATKYGERNWEKGIPVERYLDSALRHYFKFMRGDDDERHDRAFLWNCLCGYQTCVWYPELNQYPERKSE